MSQPYVFRLFGSKRALFLACMDEMEVRVLAVFRQAVAVAPDEPFEVIGAGFRDLIADGVIGGLWIESCAAARADETVAARCRTFIASTLEEVERATEAGSEDLAQFLGRGALVMMLQSVGTDLTEGQEGGAMNPVLLPVIAAQALWVRARAEYLPPPQAPPRGAREPSTAIRYV